MERVTIAGDKPFGPDVPYASLYRTAGINAFRTGRAAAKWKITGPQFQTLTIR